MFVEGLARGGAAQLHDHWHILHMSIHEPQKWPNAATPIIHHGIFVKLEQPFTAGLKASISFPQFGHAGSILNVPFLPQIFSVDSF